MTIRHSSYDTTIGLGIVMKPTELAIKEAIIRDRIHETHLDLITSLNYRPLFITGRHASESAIPFFIHPLTIDRFKGENFLCLDLRPYVRDSAMTALDEPLAVRNQTEYNFAMHRLLLNLAWVTGQEGQVRTSLPFAGMIYAAWLSEAIAKRYALDPKDQLVLSIITHYFYQSLFYSESTFDEETLQKFAVHTINASRAPANLVMEVFDKIKSMKSLAEYCEAVKQILENVRLADFNVGMLITMIGSSWFGLNAKEILAVALEHPPTWIAIVYSALSERTYRNSQIAKLVDRIGKNQVLKDFNQAFLQLTDTFRDLSDEKPVIRAFE